MTEQAELNRDEMPFVAPCKKLSPWAPFGWVKLGIKDLVQAPQHSMAYGLTVALMIGIVCRSPGSAAANGSCLRWSAALCSWPR